MSGGKRRGMGGGVSLHMLGAVSIRARIRAKSMALSTNFGK